MEKGSLHQIISISLCLAKKWRDDGRCGPNHPINGQPGQCDPNANANHKGPCCSSVGWCGNSDAHCKCDGCKDFTKGNFFKKRLRIR